MRILGVEDIQNITTEMLSLIDNAAKKSKTIYYLVGGSALGAIRHCGPIPWDYDVDIAIPIIDLKQFCAAIEKEIKGYRYYISIPGDLEDPDNITLFPRVGMVGTSIRKFHIDIFPLINAPQNEDEVKAYYDSLVYLRDIYSLKVVVNTTNGSLWKKILKRTIMRFIVFGINKEKVFNEYNELRKKYEKIESDYYVAPYGSAYGYKNILKKDLFGTPKLMNYRNLKLPVPEKIEEYLEQYYGDWTQYPPLNSIKKQLEYKVELED